MIYVLKRVTFTRKQKGYFLSKSCQKLIRGKIYEIVFSKCLLIRLSFFFSVQILYHYLNGLVLQINDCIFSKI